MLASSLRKVFNQDELMRNDKRVEYNLYYVLKGHSKRKVPSVNSPAECERKGVNKIHTFQVAMLYKTGSFDLSLGSSVLFPISLAARRAFECWQRAVGARKQPLLGALNEKLRKRL